MVTDLVKRWNDGELQRKGAPSQRRKKPPPEEEEKAKVLRFLKGRGRALRLVEMKGWLTTVPGRVLFDLNEAER